MRGIVLYNNILENPPKNIGSTTINSKYIQSFTPALQRYSPSSLRPFIPALQQSITAAARRECPRERPRGEGCHSAEGDNKSKNGATKRTSHRIAETRTIDFNRVHQDYCTKGPGHLSGVPPTHQSSPSCPQAMTEREVPPYSGKTRS